MALRLVKSIMPPGYFSGNILTAPIGSVQTRTIISPSSGSRMVEGGAAEFVLPSGGDGVGVLNPDQCNLCLRLKVIDNDAKVTLFRLIRTCRLIQVGRNPISETREVGLLTDAEILIHASSDSVSSGKHSVLYGYTNDFKGENISAGDWAQQYVPIMCEPFISSIQLPLFAVSPELTVEVTFGTYATAFTNVTPANDFNVEAGSLGGEMEINQTLLPLSVRNEIKNWIDANGVVYWPAKNFEHHVRTVVQLQGSDNVPMPFKFRSLNQILVLPQITGGTGANVPAGGYREKSAPFVYRRLFGNEYFFKLGALRYPQDAVKSVDPITGAKGKREYFQMMSTIEQVKAYTEAPAFDFDEFTKDTENDTDIGTYMIYENFTPVVNHSHVLLSGITTIGLSPFDFHFRKDGTAQTLNFDFHFFAVNDMLFSLSRFGSCGFSDLFFS
ncbi:MAG: hypothetical protein AAFO91_00485 [Bacteroidota bacterium]